MTKRPTQSDYLYASARIRAIQGRQSWQREMDRLLALPDANAVLGTLRDMTNAPADTDVTEHILREAFRAVAESVPDPDLILFLRYPYDCHNLKVLEKSRRKGTDPAPLLIDLGSVPVKALQTVWENGQLSSLPPHLRAAVSEAREAFDKTANPREIDFILDRALYADMAMAAALPLSLAWVEAKADLTNLLICCRLLRCETTDAGRSLLHRACLPAGRYDETALSALYEGGEEHLAEALLQTPYEGIFEKDLPFATIERRIENHLIALARQQSNVAFGAEVAVFYLLEMHVLASNLRILLAGKAAKLDVATIKSRMRDCYV